MIEFKRDVYDNLVEYEPESRPVRGARLYSTVCTDCGKEARYHRHTNLAKKICTCSTSKIELLIYGEMSRTLEEWAEVEPSINVGSARVRASNRRLGRRNCTDAQVLFGYGKKSPALRLQVLPTNDSPEWIRTLSEEMTRNMIKLPLIEAVVLAVKVASRERDFGKLVREDLSMYTKSGIKFTDPEGTSLPELLAQIGDLDALKDYLLGDLSLTEAKVNSFFI